MKVNKKLFALLSIMIILSLTITACSSFGEVGFISNVEIEGIEVAEHAEYIKVSNNYNDEIISFSKEDFKDGLLKGSFSNLDNEVDIELIIDNDKVDGEYLIREPEEKSVNVDEENSDVSFLIELEYTPTPESLEIDGPETVYAAKRQDKLVEYEYKAIIKDQYDYEIDRDLNWNLEDLTDNSIEISGGILSVGWDINPEDFKVKAALKNDQDISDTLNVQLSFMEDEQKVEYEELKDELDSMMADIDLMDIKGELTLPQKINDNYEIIWEASNHEAIEIIDNNAEIYEVKENTTGYIEAFIQPVNLVTTSENSDPRKVEYEARVLRPTRVNINLSLKHNYPAARVDNFFELQEFKTTSLKSIEKQEIRTASIEDTDELIVKLYEDIGLSEKKAEVERLGHKVLRKNSFMNSILIEISDNNSLKEVRRELEAMNGVEYVELNETAFMASTNHPSDEKYPYQWHYPQIRMPQAWTVNTGSRNVDIAVLDTGLDVGHPDIGDNVDVAAGYNFVDDNYDFTDYNGHGTHVTGTIAANSGTNGVSGVMWESNIIPLKVLGDGGSGGFYGIVNGLMYAAGIADDYGREPLSEPVDIINMSLGVSGYNEYLEDAINKVLDKGVIIVAASGNNGSDNMLYPAAFEGVMSVGAVDFNYPDEPRVTRYTDYNEDLDILAPGGNMRVDSNEDGYYDGVLSTGIYEGDYEYMFMEGTSMATPHVSGIIGLMLAEGIAPENVKDILTSTSMEISGYEYDAGLVNAYWALNQVNQIEVDVFRVDNGELVDSQVIDLNTKYAEFYLDEAIEYKFEARIDVGNTGGFAPGDYHGQRYFELEISHGGSFGFGIELSEKLADHVLD